MTDGIRVEIDELALHGFAPAQRAAIISALTDEVRHRLAGWSPASGPRADVDAGAVQVPHGAAPSVVGRAVAVHVVDAVRRAEPQQGADR